MEFRLILRRFFGWIALGAAILACSMQRAPEVIVITATPMPPTLNVPIAASATIPPPIAPDGGQSGGLPENAVGLVPTPDPTNARASAANASQTYTVRAGDTLIGIAQAVGTTLEGLARLNNIANPDALFVGQVLQLPASPTEIGSSFKILPDSRLVRAPGSAIFDVDAFVAIQPGYIRFASDDVNDVRLTAAQIVRRVSLEYSVDARLLLTLLEYESAWLTNPSPDERARDYPLNAPATASGFDRKGLYFQLIWAADNLNRGFYAWRAGELAFYEFADGARLLPAPDLNAGTAGVQYLLSRTRARADWARAVSAEGLYRLYFTTMGDPFVGAIEPLVPAGLQQPPLTLPFPRGETWFFTGGAHGGWGSGSAWAAVDFAPPDDLESKTTSCYISDYFATAAAAGVVARVDEGTVILDLDGDGDESTGWTILYLHLAARDRVAAGVRLNAGDLIGRPSCEGGVSNGTHLHIARRYNGEWIPASCADCPPTQPRPSFVMGEWQVVTLPGQEYQGYLARGVEQRIAEQLRGVVENRVSW
jgi:LysM repeat protein